MSDKYKSYRKAKYTLPQKTWAWNMYGAGIEKFGREGQPEQLPIPEPAENQLLVRIDSVGMCFSDVKILKQGGKHPKLYNRNLAVNPSRLGHEVALTIIKVGESLRDHYQPGQRLAVQPDNLGRNEGINAGRQRRFPPFQELNLVRSQFRCLV